MTIDSGRLADELAQLAAFSDSPAPAVTRIVFSDVDLRARAWLKGLFFEAGLEVREDAVGNTFARWTGSDPSAPAVATGSHIDAIPNSGRFDGTVGVLGGLEAIRSLQSAGFHPRRSIELVLFTSEEPTRFGIGCLGSRLLSGSLDPAKADAMEDAEGVTLAATRARTGFAGELISVKLPSGFYSAFLELHIEQGPLLEKSRTPIGIVENIAAPASLRISIEGQGGHAGAVLMPQRRDAFLGACEIALGVEAAALSTGVIDTVATTGVCRVFPGAVNSIPSAASLEIDVRDVDPARRNGVLARIGECCVEVAARRGLHVQSTILNADPPANCDARAIAAVENACRSQGLAFQRMPSRAYHDSLFMARVAPVAMIFIPCLGGVSHRPDEYATAEDIANGAAVLAEALAELAV
jgi:N-carbamoyl-L-amino-acid hydrolase